jgi:hypothetical protein
MTYYDGVLYCSMLDIDGKDDWRIPSLAEMCDKKFGLQWYREDGDNPGDYKLSDVYWIMPVRGS